MLPDSRLHRRIKIIQSHLIKARSLRCPPLESQCCSSVNNNDLESVHKDNNVQLHEQQKLSHEQKREQSSVTAASIVEEKIDSDLYDQSTEDDSRKASKEINIVVYKDEKTQQYELEPINEELSFDQGFFYAVRAIQELKRWRGEDKVICVGIAGPAGAGKTFLAKRLAELVRGLVINMERFVRVENVIDQNFEDVSLVDFPAIQQILKKLKNGESAELPKVSFQKRKTVGKQLVQLPHGRVIILDGLYALNKSIRGLLDLTISVSGGVHLDLLNRIMREVTPKKTTIEKITQIVFPMYKAYIEQDMKSAKIKIAGSYNPMNTIADPLYVCRAKFSDVHLEIEKFLEEQKNNNQNGSNENLELRTKKFKDIYLYPPKYDPNSSIRSDRQKWIRIRNANGQFYIYFYNEIMNSVVNIRPQLFFEISVKTLGGLLSLGYRIGAVIDRETTVIYDRDGIQITIDRIMGTDYVQIKGKDRNKVIKFAEQLKMSEHHIPQSFLYLHFRNLALKRRNTRSDSYPIENVSSNRNSS